jgi:hypothetical protein
MLDPQVEACVASLIQAMRPELMPIARRCVLDHPDWPIETVKSRLGDEAVKRMGSHPRFQNGPITSALVMPTIMRRVIAAVVDDVFTERNAA